MEEQAAYLADEEESYYPQSFEELCANFEHAVAQATRVWPNHEHRGWPFESRLANFSYEWPAINDALQDDRTAPRVLDLYDSLYAGSQTRIWHQGDATDLRDQVGQFVYREPERMYALAHSEDETVARAATRLLFLGATNQLLDKERSVQLSSLAPAIYQEIVAAEQPDELLEQGVIEGLSRALLWSGDDISGNAAREVLRTIGIFGTNPKTAHIAEAIRETSAANLLVNVDIPPAPEKVAEYLMKPEKLVTAVIVERLFRKTDFDGDSDEDFAAWRQKLLALHTRTMADGTEATLLHHIYRQAEHAYWDTGKAQRRIGETVLAHVALDVEALEAGWSYGRGDGRSYHYRPERYMQMNLECIAQIEDTEPGATEYLMRHHNIRNFNRLPAEIWINQYRNRDDQIRPKDVVLMARADHNVFLTFGTFERTALELAEHAQESGTDMVVFECETVSDVLRSLFGVKYHYKQQISGLYAAVHGCEFGMFFSDGLDGMLSTGGIRRYDVKSHGLKHLRSLFLPEAEGVLASCSTGLPDGPAAALAEQLQISFTGPDANTNVARLNARASGSGTTFAPQYYGAQAIRHGA